MRVMATIMNMVSRVRRSYTGIALMNMENPSLARGTKPVTAAAHEDMGAIIHTGAAVASMMYESFALDTLFSSVTGRITLPTVRQLK